MKRQRKKVAVNTRCVADLYTGKEDKVIEFHGTALGGLISLFEHEDGTIVIQVYRCDKGVMVNVGGEIAQAAQ